MNCIVKIELIFSLFRFQFFEFKAIGFDKPLMKDANGKEVFVGWKEKVSAIYYTRMFARMLNGGRGRERV